LLFHFSNKIINELDLTMASPEPVSGAPPLSPEQINAAIEELDQQEAAIQCQLAEITNKPM
jgi:hypothetical protein